MPPAHADAASFRWFLQGARGIFSLPAFILMTSFVGFSAFALESGVSRGEAMFMTAAIWALPAKMILIGMMASGANVLAVFLAVTLSSIRMMPMVASLVPELRGARTPTWLLLVLWRFRRHHRLGLPPWEAQDIPREARVSLLRRFRPDAGCGQHGSGGAELRDGSRPFRRPSPASCSS